MPTFDKTAKFQDRDLPLSKSDFEVLLREANLAAWRLVRQFRLTSFHKDDFRQELLVELLSRVAMFNPARGTLGAFAGTVVRHRAGRIANNIRREQRFFVERFKNTMYADLKAVDIARYEGRQHQHDERDLINQFSISEIRVDLKRALARLPSSDLGLCAALIEYTPAEISRNSGRSRAGVYRAIKKIRTHMETFGISAVA